MTMKVNQKVIIFLISTLVLLNSITIVQGKNRKNSNGSFANELKNLPTYDKTITGQYSGYLSFESEQDQKNHFFWFVESQNDPSTDPLVLWLNGGPGCSSSLGYLTEHGPFLVYKDSSKSGQDKYRVYENPNSWNQYASIIYMESPAGVGFSYSNNTNYTSGDTITANDNYLALNQFFSLFPEYLPNDFYIAGESYGGSYCTELSQKVVEENSNSGNTIMNLKGLMVGNPTFNYTTDAQFYLPFMSYHALLSYNEFQNISTTCGGVFAPPMSSECQAEIANVLEDFQLINPYDIYESCKGDGPSQQGGCFTQGALSGLDVLLGYTHESKREVMLASGGQSFIPCLDESAITGYLNRNDVQKALSVVQKQIPSGQWEPCSGVLNYTQYNGNIPEIYQQLIKAQLRILVFSGDVDSCVPYLGTSQNVANLGLPILNQWKPWFTKDSDGTEQTAGYIITYSTPSTYATVSYATVKGAGHMVCSYKPVQGLALFASYITNTPL
ncbi:peptidase S10 family protein [Tieghemostelium lacteum]|uniref:Carboxypeptidase n=1 Tax=Tieghemostelium lacteum TaxID=361077 RepID=A0A151ZC98_TIELA|nr:peptidase S10 family protein [Tieghemostelium lacteum]|eukprot:KYQ91504.1 peptidase S10 family protein [Tieghemostelium lacteum]